MAPAGNLTSHDIALDNTTCIAVFKERQAPKKKQ